MASPKILVADGDAHETAVLALHLRNEEYEVLCAASGREVLALARRSRPDLLLLNFGLKAGAVGVREALARDPELERLPAIFLVGLRARRRGMVPKMPAHSVILKPVVTGEMLAKVGAALAGRVRPGEVRDAA